jgi:hypothetical protein
MSFILQIFYHQSVQTVAQAANYTSGEEASVSGNSARFNSFIAEIASYLPDLSEKDEDGENDNNYWPEGLPHFNRDQHCFNLSLKVSLLTPPIMGLIARSAALAELQILDPQNALLYRTDGAVIDAQGFLSVCPAPAKLTKLAVRLKKESLLLDTVCMYFFQTLRPYMLEQGFGHGLVNNMILIHRDFGEVTQPARLECTNDGDKIKIDFFWALQCPALQSHLDKVFSNGYEAYIDYWPTAEVAFCYDFSFNPISEEVLPGLVPNYVSNESQMHAYGEVLLAWVKLMAKGFEQANSIQGLGDLILTEAFRKRELNFLNASIRTAVNQLILAALTKPTDIELWIEHSRNIFDQHRSSHRMDDVTGQYLVKLVVYARELAFVLSTKQ